MDIEGVRQRAKELGIRPAKKTMGDLIREIQKAEGNFDCFGSADVFCDQQGCVWREECLVGQPAEA